MRITIMILKNEVLMLIECDLTYPNKAGWVFKYEEIFTRTAPASFSPFEHFVRGLQTTFNVLYRRLYSSPDRSNLTVNRFHYYRVLSVHSFGNQVKAIADVFVRLNYYIRMSFFNLFYRGTDFNTECIFNICFYFRAGDNTCLYHKLDSRIFGELDVVAEGVFMLTRGLHVQNTLDIDKLRAKDDRAIRFGRKNCFFVTREK